jgi:cytochrome P450
MLLLGAANRDPEHFVEPSSLNIVREPNKHIAFGYGVHFCLGAALARLEAQTALSTILRRLPRLQLVSDDIVWSHAVFRGPRSLPTTF